MKRTARILVTVMMLSSPVLLMNCSHNKEKVSTGEQTIFPKGEAGPKENFTGKAYNFGLVPSGKRIQALFNLALKGELKSTKVSVVEVKLRT